MLEGGGLGYSMIKHVQLSPELLELISTLIKIERDNLTIICNELDEEIDHLYDDEIGNGQICH